MSATPTIHSFADLIDIFGQTSAEQLEQRQTELSAAYADWVKHQLNGVYPALLDCRIVDLFYKLNAHDEQYSIAPVLKQELGQAHPLAGFEQKDRHAAGVFYVEGYSRVKQELFYKRVHEDFKQLVSKSNAEIAQQPLERYSPDVLD